MKLFFSLLVAVLFTATTFGQGIELSGTVSLENNQIKNVADPTEAQDAVTKAYAETILSSQGLMNFNDWTTNLIDQDNVTLELETNSFVFINGNNPLLVFPETAQEFDVIYFYAFRPSDIDSGQFISNIKANGSPFIINTSGGETWTSGPNDYSSGLLFDGLYVAIFVQGSWRFTFSNFLCVSSSFDSSLLWYLDIDGDGYGDYNWTAYPSSCPPDDSGAWVNNNLDCNDEDPTVSPGATEIEDGIDNNCDGEVDEGFDGDGDGFTPIQGDCDDSDAAINPNATEIEDGIDNNCDGEIDEGFDGDGDGFTVTQGDCDDSNAAINPGADEVCDNIDNNCDGSIDENTIDAITWYFDSDADGWGDIQNSISACSQPTGYVAIGGDCDDSNAAINPEATEVCDNIDNNCDGDIDDSDASLDGTIWYFDSDADGWGDIQNSISACLQPTGYVANSGDCDDSDAAINPNATEIEDGIDNNCDGEIDE